MRRNKEVLSYFYFIFLFSSLFEFNTSTGKYYIIVQTRYEVHKLYEKINKKDKVYQRVHKYL